MWDTRTLGRQHVGARARKSRISSPCTGRFHGIHTQVAGVDSVLLGKQTFSRADLSARLRSRIDAAEAVKATRATWQKSVADERTADTSMKRCARR